MQSQREYESGGASGAFALEMRRTAPENLPAPSCGVIESSSPKCRNPDCREAIVATSLCVGPRYSCRGRPILIADSALTSSNHCVIHPSDRPSA
eukprot:CAMPEP_0204322262 /NCGR_PEP_ID=MMETSP0469-20131031/8596_1 /ASSEMBLY_ACC=CAM_ASM_000384 /TAXON_ID=2969 /ORGANISM="Oxyrrhis marina" /LENGTH=93 /DNA_ID=CAMNT_0051303601 /DNA_START=222 /DNA_END=499 /DNA_ORIENTATION=-